MAKKAEKGQGFWQIHQILANMENTLGRELVSRPRVRQI